MKRLYTWYVALISIMGCALFLYIRPFEHVEQQWLLLLLLSFSTTLLSIYIVHLPPKGNAFSLDSTIYLATIFVYGLETSLMVLLFSMIPTYFFHEKKMEWWKHVCNFAMYTCMIVGAYYSFLMLGGESGIFSLHDLGAYFVSLVVYSFINILLMIGFFSFSPSFSFRNMLISIVKEWFFTYGVTLLASLILVSLLLLHEYFGILLFTSIGLLLSFTFRQYGQLYEKVAHDKAYIEQLLNSLPIGIVTMDEATSNHFINDSAATLLRLDKKEIKQWIERERKSERNASFWDLFTFPDPFQQVKVSYERDGEEKIFLVSQSNLHHLYGEIIGRTIFFLDITEMEQLTKRIHQSEKLALMGEMAAKAAHEIRNPLAVIHGFLAFMNENLAENEREQYHIPLLLQEIDRINAIVEDMLLIAKPSAPVMKEAYMETIVQDVLSLFQQTLEAKNIRVHVRLDHVPLQLDSKQMMQVLYNLLHNSIEAMEEGGTICIYSDVDETYNMYMYDSGSGIPTHMQETIFEPFITTKSSGTGLGLTIVKRIIENHGGTIALHDSSEQGTTFVIRLPIQ
ncbi:sensor histidine kinase [Anoxybacillus ayderensis]|uniref:two-component system sensor histidine kinase NtrB n=1 Tax=Anoxybacillus sp. ST70 TaxID=2864180 RepID=UPI0010A0706D|nr:ATP-binding protein [Anoxybacillus sp. ST70]MBW9217318.1 PAS domain S-box protein [Anoxybacillus sp. ST70]THD16057.1 sensor histidine kinase [Anoxybacillus ayderensis]